MPDDTSEPFSVVPFPVTSIPDNTIPKQGWNPGPIQDPAPDYPTPDLSSQLAALREQLEVLENRLRGFKPVIVRLRMPDNVVKNLTLFAVDDVAQVVASGFTVVTPPSE